MADVKSIPEAVAAAEKSLYGEMAQAQSLVEIIRTSTSDDPYAVLAEHVLDRLCNAVDQYHTELLRHGVPSFDERTVGVQPTRIELGGADA
jgi:hypothetical protein